MKELIGESYEKLSKRKLLDEIYTLKQKLLELENSKNQYILNESKIIRLYRLYSILSRVNEAIVRIKRPKKLFEYICRIAVEDGGFKMAWVGLLNFKTLKVKPVAYWGSEEGYLKKIKISAKDNPEGRGPTGTAVRENEYCIINNHKNDPRMEPWRNKAIERGYYSSGAFPLRIGKKVIGAITFHSPDPDFFNDDEIKLLDMLANDVSFAIESYNKERQRRKIEKELRLSQEQLRKLSLYLQTIREEERTYIAHKLHDELGQYLSVLKMDVFDFKNSLKNIEDSNTIERLNKMVETIDILIRNIRKTSTELRPVVLDHLGIKAALEWFSRQFEEQTKIKCNLTLPKNNISLDSQYSIIIFRICQEALSNVYKHAKANNVKINLHIDKNFLYLKIYDNGVGIKKKDLLNPNSFGLLGIYEQIKSLNGEFNIKGTKNKGTSLTVKLPL